MTPLRLFDSLHDVSLPAVAVSGLIHVLAALAFAWSLPPRPVATLKRAIDVTLVPLTPPSVERAKAADPTLDAEQVIAPPAPDVSQATLEQQLPPIEEPPPFSARELARAAPASVPALAPPRPRIAPQPAEADRVSRRRIEEDYLVGVIQKLSRYRFVPHGRETSAHGMVVARLTVARDGSVRDVALIRSSGFPGLDSGVLDTIRRASPFAPLPGEVQGNQVSFTVPIAYDRQR